MNLGLEGMSSGGSGWQCDCSVWEVPLYAHTSGLSAASHWPLSHFALTKAPPKKLSSLSYPGAGMHSFNFLPLPCLICSGHSPSLQHPKTTPRSLVQSALHPFTSACTSLNPQPACIGPCFRLPGALHATPAAGTSNTFLALRNPPPNPPTTRLITTTYTRQLSIQTIKSNSFFPPKQP